MLSGFRKFILRGNVVDLAVGFVIGAAFASVVSAAVTDLIQPLIGLFFHTSSFDTITVGPANHPFYIGKFIGTLIYFLIVAAVVYFFVVLPITKLQDRFTSRKEPAKPTTRECPFCLSTVPLEATRCAYCTAQLTPVEVADAGTPST